MTAQQKKRCEQFVSIFENDSIDIQYDYVENIHDGRGYTCGKFGFTTATGDAYELVQTYTSRKSDNPLAKYLPELKRLARLFSNDTSHLDGFPEAWHQAVKDSQFIRAQDDVSARLTYLPAMKWAASAKITSALGKCTLYDCIIEHGDGDDGDSLGAIFNRTIALRKGVVKDADDEQYWIRAFLDMRLDDFDHPHDKINIDHQKGWHDDSVQRVYAMQTLLNQYNMDLNGPIHVKTKDHNHVIP
ncbi:chitosanase-like [Oppia nitens]|uniref:chitosanase-like n=1 Tax=Oppia nitens TaxID=1686743 RepID=UPI0023DB6FB5|nr:chitosanase-like [Oppia nitens]